jgi:hypothetical protein
VCERIPSSSALAPCREPPETVQTAENTARRKDPQAAGPRLTVGR